MPSSIPLQAIPNQSFNVTLNNMRYNFVIKQANNIMTVTLSRGVQLLLTNIIAKPNSVFTPSLSIIAYQYLENNQGNFFIFTENSEYPFYDKFGTTQFMLYYSADEMGSLRENS